MWIKREIEDVLRQIATKRPSLILTGARQAGKTSLLKRVFPEHNYVTLDIPLNAQEAEESGETFLKKYPPPLIVDEVQYAPKLLRYIKTAIDQNREASGRFLITGSQKFSLMQGVTESLAGRTAILQCHSLSAREYQNWTGKPLERDSLLEFILKGGYPELHAKSLSPESFYSDYLATYLERDVTQALQVRSLRDFDRFLRLAASRTAQLLNINSLATDVGVSPNTIKSWLSILEASNVIYFLEPYYQNLGKRIVKSPKLYFLDTGFCCFLVGIRQAKDFHSNALLGSLFETHVLGQIIRHFANRGVQPPLYFYRDHYGHEVDFMIPVGNAFRLIECKWSENPSLEVRGFQEILKIVGPERVLSQSIVNQIPGTRKTQAGITVEDSVHLENSTG
ncbi:MAG: ATP-binding protein [Deltaproteobacteria bacterium]|nr:ATP-binding protein [Deltaproteobacteria bacterium]